MLHGPETTDPSELYLRWFGHLTLADLWEASSLPTLLSACGFTVRYWQRLDRADDSCAVGITTDPDGRWRVLGNDAIALTPDDEDLYWHRPIHRARMLHLLLDRSPARPHPSLGELVDDLATAEVYAPVDDGWLAGVALRAALRLLPPTERDAHATLIALGHPETARALVELDGWYASRPDLEPVHRA